ncbi:SDR family oxidoreductase [Tunturiibacter empetritectus]|uniref:NADH-flavin reductase n=1 Tax=Tunturiibacter lichenicola TaxID=2051959 RepID=A0A852VLG8_9BACT|nr:NAD(P)-binding oxidoreductase [Edaphobacter lichenicola]NYF90406.1 putative NADH-flavin reductase [Edaphobacter lichenicola]
MNNVLVFGAGGKLGRAIVAALLREGFSVTASVRNLSSYRAPVGVRVAVGDAMNTGAVAAALEGQDAVVNAIGAGTLRRNSIESETTSVILRTIQKTSIRRYIGMSAGMVDTRVLPLGVIPATIFRILLATLFRNIRKEHRAVEKLVTGTQLDWTIVRPSRLTNSQTFADYRLSTEGIIPGTMSVPCATVAHFITSELRKNEYVRKAVFIG